MDAPPIQYCRTEDGVNIAYWTTGEGPPLLYLSNAPGYFGWAVGREIPGNDVGIARLAEHWTVVQLDHRGSGLSDHAVEDRSLDGLLADIDAVTDALGLAKMAVFGQRFSGPLAIAFAARHPERVTHLILWCTFVSRAIHRASPRITALRGARTDWTTFTETLARLLLGWSAGDEAGRFAALIRSTTTPEAWWAASTARDDDDATPYLAAVRAPTLVAFRTESDATAELSRPLAAGIANARMVALPGDAVAPWFGDADAVFNLLYAFLEPTSDPDVETPSPGPAIVTLLFTDLESSTALTQSLGDAKAQKVLHGHNDAVRAALAANGGEEVKHTGDGIFAAFGSAVSAVEAALQIQRDLAGGEVRVRVGLNAGEPIAEDDDYFGTAVQLAARVCDRAEPGQVLVSNVVRELCAGKTFAFTDQGEATLKGFAEPVRLFVVEREAK